MGGLSTSRGRGGGCTHLGIRHRRRFRVVGFRGEAAPNSNTGGLGSRNAVRGFLHSVTVLALGFDSKVYTEP